MSSGSFKYIINKMCLQIIFEIYVLAGFGIRQPTMMDMP